MTPSWYDVLGVSPAATSDEVRAAWRASVDGLDPTDRQFRLRNRAAEVLLDPDKRAAHDADLAADDEAEFLREAVLDQTPPSQQRSNVAMAPAPVVAPTTAPAPVEPRRASRTRQRWTTIVMAILALVLVVATVIAAVHVAGSPADAGGQRTSGGLPDEQQVAAALSAAQAAIVPVLAYDYRSLPQDEKQATSYMTPEFAKEYEQYFDASVVRNAPTSKTVVQVQVLDSGVVRTAPGQVDVLLFVNRPTTNKQRSVVYHDQVTARMVDTSGSWLVGCLITMPDGRCGTA